MKDSVVPDVYRHVIDTAAGAGEEKEVTRKKGANVERNRLARRGLFSRGPRQLDAVSAEDILHEPGTIKS